ncbi:hypothetical protein FRB95_014635 [Tulasnella sp. JGI-2019a]|nr:hypothetical protein FRB95_014635 [Tulasnella sp. JGI-2019a]
MSPSDDTHSSLKIQWITALDGLPSITEGNGKIPAFFFGHGNSMLLRNPNIKSDGHVPLIMESQGPRSPLAAFLKDFGPALLRKYNPKVIVVFSAHWETEEETLGPYENIDTAWRFTKQEFTF